jgi:hypothetical protein
MWLSRGGRLWAARAGRGVGRLGPMLVSRR